LHRTASLNEISARYSELPEEFYLPKSEHVRGQHATNKQASGEALDPFNADIAQEVMEKAYQDAYRRYKYLLERGVARELARIVLPVAIYTECYWKIDLNNLLKFLKLRLDWHAQWECRQYAEAMAEFVKQRCPLTWEAFEKHVLKKEE